jgi:polyribonucleotide nucleotidyltransferase
MQKTIYSTEVGGKTLTAEFNDLASQANGSVLVRYGNTVVMATAVMSAEDKDSGFFPLTVDYELKFYASGQILGSRFVRREGKPSDESILSGRIVDRTIRPLFDQWIRREIQIIITVLSVDEDDPDTLGVIAASLAIGTSNIPWNGPVGAIRLGKTKDSQDFLINPTFSRMAEAGYEFDLVACGKDGNITMIEVGSREVSNELVVSAFTKANEEIEKLQKFQTNIIKEIGKQKIQLEQKVISNQLVALYKEHIAKKVEPTVFIKKSGKDHIEDLKDEWLTLCIEKYPDENFLLADEYFEEQVNNLIHKRAIEKKERPDGRGLDDLRALYAQAGGISPILHGSGIFYRGETHVFSALTLGGPKDAQILDGSEMGETKRFMHHYNFPPFSTGETGRAGSTNRRMIGHGALAEKALLSIIPTKEVFPYTIRLVSETMSSNGSSSMASVCASSLALMDGGVPISAPVAGIASGLMLDEKNHKRYALLTDIQGPEDHHGDMDFKVAGTRKGITAIQMDVKVSGIPIHILKESLDKAATARLKILDVIEKEIAQAREKISPQAPEILSLTINPDQIGMVIGPGGKMIKAIKEKTGAEIDIEDDGTVFITGKQGAAEKAKVIIANMTREYKKGERFTGEVVKIAEFGAFVNIGPDTDGLVHISEIAPFRVDRVEKYLKLGDKVPVIIKDIDEKKRLSLSIKQADQNFIKSPK